MDERGPMGEHAERLLELLPVGVVSIDRGWHLRYVNGEAERLLRTPRERLIGRTQWELFPDTVGTELDNTYRRVMGSGQPVRFEQYYPAHDIWYELTVVPVPDGLEIAFADVTARKRSRPAGDDGATDGAARAGLALLTQVTQALGSTLEPVEGVRRLARLLVPHLADWCIVSLLDGDTGTLRDLAVAHRDPDRQRELERYAVARVPALSPASPVRESLVTGRPVLIGDGGPASTDHIADAVLLESGAKDMLRRLGPGAAVAVPLMARGRVNGVVSIYRDVGEPVWDDAALRLAAEIAARAGMALDNARLYADRRDVALRLQEAMLTALPEPDHLELRARYLPAASGEQVGGDWYDAIRLPSGATALVVGDVVGHDMAAAALMGQVRTMLRTLAWQQSGPPSSVVDALDRALDGLGVDTVATCVVATVEQTRQEAAHGLRRLHWTNAGHPPPVLLHADGAVEVLERATDLVLGVHPDVVRTDHEHVLPAGSTVLLYTDGLIERRRSTLEEGMTRLAASLTRHADRTLDDLLDGVLDDMVGPGHDDDVALLAVRAHREDRARPAEAGPGDAHRSDTDSAGPAPGDGGTSRRAALATGGPGDAVSSRHGVSAARGAS